MIAGAPDWLHWALQPRPTLGAAINTAGDTDQFYFGSPWSWMLAHNIVNQDDGIALGFFFGPGFNNGEIRASTDDRKSLGSNVLFREALDLGYQITVTWEISAYIDHVEWRVGQGEPKPQRRRPAPRLSLLGDRSRLFRGQYASELAERLLMPLIRNLREIACELETHAFARRDRPGLLTVEPVEEVVDRHAQHMGNLEQSPGRDTVDPAFVFMRLLIGDAD
jgi:hypothetical protein